MRALTSGPSGTMSLLIVWTKTKSSLSESFTGHVTSQSWFRRSHDCSRRPFSRNEVSSLLPHRCLQVERAPHQIGALALALEIGATHQLAQEPHRDELNSNQFQHHAKQE